MNVLLNTAISLNKVSLIGRVSKEPIIRQMKNGNPVANLTLVTLDKWYDPETGKPKERKQYHKIVFYNEGLCYWVERFLNKGAIIHLEGGSIQTRKWTDKNGNNRYITEVIFGDGAEIKRLDIPTDASE